MRSQSVITPRLFAAGLAIATLSACGGAAHAQAHPEGWLQQGQGATAAWVDPAGHQRYWTSTRSTGATTLKDLSAEVASDTVLSVHGARMNDVEPLPSCPGEAGVQTYRLPGGDVLEVAFGLYQGQALLAYYRRPARLQPSPAALKATASTVCTAIGI
jgi:hypothetical protein